MISALKLFQEHNARLALHQILCNELKDAQLEQRYYQENLDMEIEAQGLRRAPLSDLPKRSTGNMQSPTERIVEHIEDIVLGKRVAAIERKLHETERLIHLFDAILPLFSEKEQWFIENYFLRNQLMTQIIENVDSPFYGYDRTTVWRYKKRLLEKAERVLAIVYEQRG